MSALCLFHFDVKLTDDMKEMFCNVKFVCIGGSAKRMNNIASVFAVESGTDAAIISLSGPKARYSLCKVKNVLIADHGIGIPSITIVINEIAKLLKYAGCKDVAFIRIGTCGGIGVEPGCIVITDRALDTQFKPVHRTVILGKVVERPTVIDENLVTRLQAIADRLGWKGKVITGATVCTNDFYEEEEVSTVTEIEKRRYFELAYQNGVRNIEMESVGLAAHCKLFGHRAAVICTAMASCLQGDTITLTDEEHENYQMEPVKLVCELLKEDGAI